MIVVPVIALRGGGPRVAVDVAADEPTSPPVSGHLGRSGGVVTLATATVSAGGQDTSDAPEVSVAAAAEVAPTPVNSLLATVRSARYTPLGSTAAVVAQRTAEMATPRTTRRPVTTKGTTAAPRTATGEASWYQAAPGTCAHPTLPFGTVVTILDVANGHTATCTVDDRGPYEGGRIIDLSYDVFEQLAPAGLGIIDVRLSW
jgi:rare lipoprotein A (peptidoglycan hydrolase)